MDEGTGGGICPERKDSRIEGAWLRSSVCGMISPVADSTAIGKFGLLLGASMFIEGGLNS